MTPDEARQRILDALRRNAKQGSEANKRRDGRHGKRESETEGHPMPVKLPGFVDAPTLRWAADRHEDEIDYAKKQIARLGTDPKVASTVGYWRVVIMTHQRMRADFRRQATRIEKGKA